MLTHSVKADQKMQVKIGLPEGLKCKCVRSRAVGCIGLQGARAKAESESEELSAEHTEAEQASGQASRHPALTQHSQDQSQNQDGRTQDSELESRSELTPQSRHASETMYSPLYSAITPAVEVLLQVLTLHPPPSPPTLLIDVLLCLQLSRRCAALVQP